MNQDRILREWMYQASCVVLMSCAGFTLSIGCAPARDLRRVQPLTPASPVPFRNVRRVQFEVLDPVTYKPIPGARIILNDGRRAPVILAANTPDAGVTPTFDTATWKVTGAQDGYVRRIALVAGASTVVDGQAGLPTGDIYIRVVATRLQLRPTQTSAATNIGHKQIQTFVNTVGSGIKAVTQGQSGVASDSAGQQHIRGEHAEISYVVDGVPLPDTLAGSQGSVVVPATIESLEMITGGFAPEFGGETAAVLNIFTLPLARKEASTATVQVGTYQTTNGDIQSVGPLSDSLSYVLDINATRTNNAIEPQQPDNQTAHNAGANQSYFLKLSGGGRSDLVTLTLSRSVNALQINNRTGLPASFVGVGQGYGFLGLRNANGVRPDVTSDNAGLLGAAPETLPSQQAEGQDIDQDEVSEFATLSERHQLNKTDSANVAVTFLHSGQDLRNHNPAVDELNLPVDNSIEYNPTASRNIHHFQVVGSVTAPRGPHEYKAGFLTDSQSGSETYQLIPASQLALNDLAALAPNLVPAGSVQMDASGNPVMDVNGNPVYVPTSAMVPTLNVQRTGFYRAAYGQDTWKVTHALTANYGLRFDWYRQAQNLGLATVNTALLSPRLNLSYAADRSTVLRASYNRLLNVPPLAQGAIIGQPIVPEKINQYDVSLRRQLAPGQVFGLAYYYKQIRDQVDTGLLIPGSWLGLYSAVNFQFGSVHGIEASYDFSPPKGVGWDGYVNYTYSIAKPGGVDNTGAPVPEYNDHDQRHTIGAGLAYLLKGGASAAATLNYGSGLASSSLTPTGPRISRYQVDLHGTTGPQWFNHKGGLGLDVINLLDARTVINFESGFSGTRFMQGRRVLLSGFLNF